MNDQRTWWDRLVGRAGRLLPASMRELPPLRELRRRRRVRARHPAAVQLLAGRHTPASNGQSILYYTVHRCASSFVTRLLAEIAEVSGLTPVDFDSYFFQLNGRSVDSEILAHPRRREAALRARGYVFGPLRRFDHVPNRLREFRLILVLRDPRDVLTSLFFSMAHSHSLPAGASRRTFARERERARRQGLDAFVKERSERMAETYGNYCRLLAGGHPHLTLLRYEEMVSSFESWLERLVAGCGLECSPELIRDLVARADFTVKDEDPNSRRRQVQPGDHRRKLSAQTIVELNEKLGAVLRPLGYSE